MKLATDLVVPLWQLVASSALIALLYHFVIYPVLLSPLSQIPQAHWSSSISSVWILYTRFIHRENRVLLEAHRRLGPIVRVGPDQLSVNDIDLVRTIYGGGFEKTNWYSVFNNYSVPCMFSNVPSREHSLRKRMISNVYSKSYIQSSAPAQAQARVILFERLLPLLQHSASKSHAPYGIDIHSVFLATTMDFISAYIFGLRDSTNFIQNAAYRDHWLQLYMSRHDYPFFPQELPWLTWLLQKLRLSPYPKWVDAANQELEDWHYERCRAAMESNTKTKYKNKSLEDRPVVLKTLLAGLDKETEFNGKDSVIFRTVIQQPELSVNSELLDHVLAGQETAGVTLTYLTWHLSMDQDLQRKIQEELLSLGPTMSIQNGTSGSIPNLKALDALPLLNSVLMEVLRLHAALPGPLPRETPFPSCRLGPYTIPGGIRIAALAHTLHRNETVFPEPEKFDHTRWIRGEVDEDVLKERSRQFWAFSSGGRMCIGSNFAMHEMKLIVAAIYLNFTSHVVDDTGMEQTDGYTGRPAGESLYLRFEPIAS